MNNDTGTLGLTGQWHLQRLDPNLVVLDYCQYRIEDGPWSETMPVVQARAEVFAALGLNELQNYQPWFLLKHDRYPTPRPVSLRYVVNSEVDLAGAGLVVEHLERWELSVNGVELTVEPTGWVWDRNFVTCDLGDCLRQGRNVIELRSTLQRDLEIEDIFVTGDFAVELDAGVTPRIVAESRNVGIGDWTAMGYPFYAGTMRYSAEVALHGAAPSGARLRLPAIAGVCALVQVNDHEPTWLAWEPWEVPISRLLRPGVNRVTIDLYTSLRNAFGPLHHKDSNSLTWVGPEEFEPGPNWTDAYVLQPHGLLGDVVILTD